VASDLIADPTGEARSMSLGGSQRRRL
jgi:hypothetical protein